MSTGAVVLAILAPALTALLGAWAGAHLALRRFQTERAFDRRLGWFERTESVVGEMCFLLDEVDRCLKRDDREGTDNALKRIEDVFPTYIRESNAARLYASEGAVQALREGERKIEEMLKNSEASFSELFDAFSELHVQIANEARTHLGMESIEEN